MCIRDRSIRPFIAMLKKAARDPEVISIKMTLYRMARESQIVQALIEAAENGKEVVALVELRARFDEQNNIDWSKQLEEAGCTILYGFDDYKVHSKMCIRDRRRSACLGCQQDHSGRLDRSRCHHGSGAHQASVPPLLALPQPHHLPCHRAVVLLCCQVP